MTSAHTSLLVKFLASSGIGAASGGVLHSVWQAVGGEHLSLSTIVEGGLTAALGFLFTVFIRQGNKLAALQATAALREDVASLRAYAERNKADLDRLDAEARSVDKRIEASRHLGAQATTVRFLETEDRLVKRLDELGSLLAGLNDKLQRHLEAGRSP